MIETIPYPIPPGSSIGYVVQVVVIPFASDERLELGLGDVGFDDISFQFIVAGACAYLIIEAIEKFNNR